MHGLQNDCTKVHYRNSLGDNILTVGKKEFNHADHQLKFKEAWVGEILVKTLNSLNGSMMIKQYLVLRVCHKITKIMVCFHAKDGVEPKSLMPVVPIGYSKFSIVVR